MIERILVYKELLEDEIIRDSVSYLFNKDDIFLHGIIRRIYSAIGVQQNAFERYIFEKVMASENEFSLEAEKQGKKILENGFLIDTVKKDITLIKDLLRTYREFDYTVSEPFEEVAFFLKESSEQITKRLIELYHYEGCGRLYGNSAYLWDDGIRPVREPDSIRFDDLIDYERHKKTIINNTKAFIDGAPYNNILLFGDRGTGKSSCVKAAYNMFKKERLRIIELAKKDLDQIQDVMNFMRRRGFFFILFLDDLSFEENEYEYKELKAHLEGGLELQPPNVVIYATSNRYHIVKETEADNRNITDELHLNDAIQEKLSLADRFGITITFDTPGPKSYLHIVRELLKKQGISYDDEKIDTLARRWELNNHGRSGRSAVQFVRTLTAGIDDDMKPD